jgi:8-oxo-dGTP diphosphatase
VTSASPVLAAGAVCWRIVDGKPRVLLVHRAAHADVGLPKGKLDPGETLPQTAKREVQEETGLTIDLGAPLGTVEYRIPSGRDKVVHYWSAEVSEHALQIASFTPNEEIASLEWAPLAKARKKLTYEHDVDVLDRFAERFERGVARTFALIVLRHGKAVPADAWDGPDATRPLLQRGNDQSASIAAGVAAFSPERLVSSPAVRCMSTIAPVSGYLGIPVKKAVDISQDAFEHGQADVRAVVLKRLAKRKTAVLCSHGPVIPEILDELSRQTNSAHDPALRRAALLGTAEYVVVHVPLDSPTKGIVAVETHTPAVN